MKILDNSNNIFTSLKKDILGESRIKLKKQTPEIIKSNTFQLLKIFSDYDYKTDIDSSRKTSLFFKGKGLAESGGLDPLSNTTQNPKSENSLFAKNNSLNLISKLDTCFLIFFIIFLYF